VAGQGPYLWLGLHAGRFCLAAGRQEGCRRRPLPASLPSATPPEGTNKATLETLLSSWDATLRLCQLDIQPMVKLYGTASSLSDDDLTTAAKQYNELIASFAA
jgi:hypothetical protein